MTNVCLACQTRPHPSHMWLCTDRRYNHPGCYEKLEANLSAVPALWKDLGITLSRQDAIGGDGGRRGSEVVLSFKPQASEARYVLTNTLGSWARLLSESLGLEAPANPVKWLRVNVASLAMHEAAGEAVEEIASAVHAAYRTIDRPPELLFAGRCPTELCTGVLYAKPASSEVQCRVCEQVHDVAERRRWMVNAAAVLRVNQTTALSWVKLLMDREIPYRTWQSWRARGRIHPVDFGEDGQTLYRFGDVRDLAIAWMARGTAA